MVYKHARRRRSLLKVAVCQPLGLRDIILARALRSSTSISLVGSIYSILLNKLGDFFIHFLLRLCRQSHWFNWRRSKAPVKSSKKEGFIPNLGKLPLQSSGSLSKTKDFVLLQVIVFGYQKCTCWMITLWLIINNLNFSNILLSSI